MSDEKLSESTTCMRHIDPKLKDSGWDLEKITREYHINKGQIIPEGKSGKRKDPNIADYVLKLGPDYKIAVVEAKAYDLPHDQGMQQALIYAEKMNLKFAYATNGKKIEEYDFITKQQRTIDKFPTPHELLERRKKELDFDEKQMDILLEPLDRTSKDPGGSSMEPRYYQEIAINAALTSILAGKKRVLLTLATGTGKTFISYQIAQKLWNKDTPHPKILFLADRTILLDQAKNNAFANFGEARHKIQRKVQTAYEMYFALYQALDVDKEDGELYKQYPKNYFDYVIIDECHRGSSTESGNWRKILEYFSDATHIGMTATPKRDDESKDTYDYFGIPAYTYSLKQGIEDGFLAPYMIHRVNLEIDVNGYTPKAGEKDLNGKLLENRKYTYKDFDRILIVNERRKAVAHHLVNFLEKNNQKFNKTILFCQNSEHALAMTKLIRNYSGEGHNYCARIVSAEGEIGRQYLDHFQEPNKDFPVVAITSRLMSTGVDVPTCKIIALDKNINSMTDFKQIIGRGTRVYEPKDKMWFSLIDYRNTTRLFKDEEWDGPPVAETEEEQENMTKEKEKKILEKANAKREKDAREAELPPKEEKEPTTIETYHIEGQKVEIRGESVLIFDQSIDGNRLISYQDYTGETVRRLINDKETELHKIWTEPENRKHFVKELENRGVTFEHLREITEMFEADAFDLLLHFAFNADAKTRLQRADSVRKKAFLEKYPEKAREVLDVILDHYSEAGYQELEGREILELSKFKQFGGPVEIITQRFKDGDEYDNAMIELTKELYSEN